MIRSFKIRLYPTKEQEELMWKHVGCCRYVWNYMLGVQQECFKNNEKHLSGFDMTKMLTLLKHDGEHEWLYDVSNTSLQIICRDLDKSYKALFKHIAKPPRLKSRKKSKPNFPVRSDRVWFSENDVNIQKIGKIKYKTDFSIPTGRKSVNISNARISFNANKWYLSFGMERESQAYSLTDDSMGIDLGVKELATVSHGSTELVFHNINKSKKMRNLDRRIKLLQRSISRKYEANRQGKRYIKTRNIERQEEELRRLFRKQRNIRNNYIHQTTHTLVSLLPKRVVMEDLNVKGMMANHKLARAIAAMNFYEFKRQMQYKCEERGIEFVEADRFYPSSKTCSCCGAIKHDLKLRDRIFECECGYVKDRDMNAAINLMRYVG